MAPRWRIVVGSDNAGINYKNALKAFLQSDSRVASVDDVGVATPSDDTAYPHIAVAAAQKIAAGHGRPGAPVLRYGAWCGHCRQQSARRSRRDSPRQLFRREVCPEQQRSGPDHG